MSSGHASRREFEQQQRELRTRIARVRRQLGRRVDRLAEQGFMLRSWRGYVEDHPARSLAAAAGLGLLLATLGGRDGALARIGSRLVDLTSGGSWAGVWREIQHVFVASADSSDASGREGADRE